MGLTTLYLRFYYRRLSHMTLVILSCHSKCCSIRAWCCLLSPRCIETPNARSELQQIHSAARHALLGGIENVWATSLLFGVLVLFTLTWEFLTEKLEHFVADHHAYQVSRRRDSHPAAPPSTISRCFNVDIQGVSSK